MSGFTKGPWIAPAESGAVYAHGRDCRICDIRGWGYFTGGGAMNLPPEEAIKIQRANAHLIAAAPDMYEALKALHRLWGVGCSSDKFVRHLRDEVMPMVHDSIAKAEGRDMARIIAAQELFSLNREIRSGHWYSATQARQSLKDIAVTHNDMVVANVASKLSRQMVNCANGNSGGVA